MVVRTVFEIQTRTDRPKRDFLDGLAQGYLRTLRHHAFDDTNIKTGNKWLCVQRHLCSNISNYLCLKWRTYKGY
jgi:hypothetical protein